MLMKGTLDNDLRNATNNSNVLLEATGNEKRRKYNFYAHRTFALFNFQDIDRVKFAFDIVTTINALTYWGDRLYRTHQAPIWCLPSLRGII